jgi:hypothetical protein
MQGIERAREAAEAKGRQVRVGIWAQGSSYENPA